MSEIRYVATVLGSGALSPPADVELEAGQEVEVVLRVRRNKPQRRRIDPLEARMSPEAWKAHEERQRELEELTARVTGPKDLARNWAHHLAKNRST
jgi:hypothetical protein